MSVTSEVWGVFCEVKNLYLSHIIVTIWAVSTMANEFKKVRLYVAFPPMPILKSLGWL